MLESKKIKVGKLSVQAVSMKLLDKSLIVIRGSKGYIMCGYLNLSVANKFGEVAIKITGVSSISDALKSKVCSASYRAKKLGIRKNQEIKNVLKIIA